MDPVLWGALVAFIALVVAITFVLRRRQSGTTSADEVRGAQGHAEAVGYVNRTYGANGPGGGSGGGGS